MLNALVLLLLSSAANAAPRAFDADHPWSIGVRGAAWQAGYTAPGGGGHVRYRPSQHLGVEAFWNSFAVSRSPRLLHDHVIGFHTYVPLVGGERWLLAPAVGACVDFRFQTDLQHTGPSTSDIRFGTHAGFIAERQLARWLSAELNGATYAYWGHPVAVDGWTATPSTHLKLQPATQLTAAVNVRL